jgi:hypothetical protein
MMLEFAPSRRFDFVATLALLSTNLALATPAMRQNPIEGKYKSLSAKMVPIGKKMFEAGIKGIMVSEKAQSMIAFLRWRATAKNASTAE